MTRTPRHLARIFIIAAAGCSGVLLPRLLAQAPIGLIGSRHVEASVFYEDIDAAGVDDGLGLAVRANIPLHPVLDLAISGAHEEIDTNDFRERSVFATLVAHWNARDITPYVTLGAGNVWQSVRIDGEKISEDEAVFAAGLGFEAPVADRTALDGRVTYHRYADNDLDAYWIYGLGLNHGFTERVVGTVSVQFRESDSIIVSVGAAFRF